MIGADLLEVVELEQVEEVPWLHPNDPSVEYIVGISIKGDAFFVSFPNIWEGYNEMGSLLDDNGFSYPEGLGAGVYAMKFDYTETKDRETDTVDGWEFDCKGEPELIYEVPESLIEEFENEDNL